MSRDSKPHGFRDVESKLNAPSKKSIFERQKAEAEAKRLKEQRETAAVYQDFVKSFDDGGGDDDDDDDDDDGQGGVFSRASRPDAGRGPPAAAAASAGKRYFSSAAAAGALKGPRMVSGPGTLGAPAPAPPPSRKRTHEGSAAGGGATRAQDAFGASDDEDGPAQARADDRAAHRPTVHMSSLPPGMSAAAIRAVLPRGVAVEGVRALPAHGAGPGRRSMAAIVTLAADTPASDLDALVSQLQNRYLGRGYHLSLSRHLSSAVADSALPAGALPVLPFGAKAVAPPPGRGFAPVQARGTRGFAPPASLMHPASAAPSGPAVRVAVAPPPDLRQIKLIHKMVESITVHGPEFEALAMSRPEVQSEERWAWLWDASSPGGIWYRWKLWETLTKTTQDNAGKQRKKTNKAQQIFDRSAPWVAEEPDLPFEFALSLDEFVSDPEYDSSEDEDSGDEGRRRLQHLQSNGPASALAAASADADGSAYLNPLRKAKLMHLISRVPDSNARLRKGDVARVTAFAIQNAGEGAEEVVNLLTANVLQPFSTRDRAATTSEGPDGEAGSEEPKQTPADESDPAAAKLVALYLISDILSSSSTSGVRHAWRYRQLFEASLRKKHVFEHLGRLEKELKWGRLKAEKWRRAVTNIMSLWEGWSVFTTTAQDEFVEVFKNPPQTAEEKAAAELAEQEAKTESAVKRWKTVKGSGTRSDAPAEMPQASDAMDVDEYVDGEAMEEDTDEDLDGVPMEDSDAEDAAEPQDAPAEEAEEREASAASEDAAQGSTAPQLGSIDMPSGGRKGRPRAVDMFGDSDDE